MITEKEILELYKNYNVNAFEIYPIKTSLDNRHLNNQLNMGSSIFHNLNQKVFWTNTAVARNP